MIPDRSAQYNTITVPKCVQTHAAHMQNALRFLGFTIARGQGQSRWVLLSDDTGAIVLYADSMERIGRFLWASYREIIDADVLACLRRVKDC